MLITDQIQSVIVLVFINFSYLQGSDQLNLYNDNNLQKLQISFGINIYPYLFHGEMKDTDMKT